MKKSFFPLLFGAFVFSSAVLAGPDDKTQAMDYYNKSGERIESGDLNGGWQLINESIRLNPNYGRALSRRCNLLIRVEQYAKALSDCEQALKLEPNYAPAHLNKARILKENNQLKPALKEYTTSIQLDPSYSGGWAYLERGDIRLDLQDYRGGVDDLTLAIQSGNDVCKACAYMKRGWGWNQLQDYRRGEADYNEAIRLEAEHPPNYEGRGRSREGQGYLAGAKVDYLKAAALFKAQGRSSDYLRVMGLINNL
jgi:tetratricopeptide (TPR) repeat protein